ncbi:hypothetical protein U1Q18_007800 [Sarracenia purpurea var. burkii]
MEDNHNNKRVLSVQLGTVQFVHSNLAARLSTAVCFYHGPYIIDSNTGTQLGDYKKNGKRIAISSNMDVDSRAIA